MRRRSQCWVPAKKPNSPTPSLPPLLLSLAQAMGEDIMKNIMADFERMGEKEDFQQVVDGMMKQLLSKEIM